MRKVLIAVVALAAIAPIAAMAVRTEAGSDLRPTRYVILYEAHASPTAVREAVRQAGGRLLRANNEVGVATAISANPKFLTRAVASRAVQGVAPNMRIGRAQPRLRPKLTVELQRSLRNAAKRVAPGQQRQRSGTKTYHHGGLKPEPFADLQWDMKMMHATVDGSYRKEQGSKKVLVGVIDTGIDGNHPDIKPNFDKKLSRPSDPHPARSTARGARRSRRRAATPKTSTRTPTARTWQARSARRSTGSAWPEWHPM